MNKEEVVS